MKTKVDTWRKSVVRNGIDRLRKGKVWRHRRFEMASTVYERGKRDGIDVSKWHQLFTKGENVTASTFRNGIDCLRKGKMWRHRRFEMASTVYERGNCDRIDVSKWHQPFTKGETVTASTFRNGINRLRKGKMWQHQPFTKGETVTASTFRNGIDRVTEWELGRKGYRTDDTIRDIRADGTKSNFTFTLSFKLLKCTTCNLVFV